MSESVIDVLECGGLEKLSYIQGFLIGTAVKMDERQCISVWKENGYVFLHEKGVTYKAKSDELMRRARKEKAKLLLGFPS